MELNHYTIHPGGAPGASRPRVYSFSGIAFTCLANIVGQFRQRFVFVAELEIFGEELLRTASDGVDERRAAEAFVDRLRHAVADVVERAAAADAGGVALHELVMVEGREADVVERFQQVDVLRKVSKGFGCDGAGVEAVRALRVGFGGRCPYST